MNLDESPDDTVSLRSNADHRRAVRHLTRPSAMRDALLAVGGTPYAVGGCVRDACMGMSPKDVDVEVHGVEFELLRSSLGSALGRNLDVVGRSFGVLKADLDDVSIDVSVPRTDSKSGPGHKGFDVAFEPHIGFPEAARRRDLTINSMGVDLRTGEFCDPYNGLDDLREGRLRAVDHASFIEDPLRVLRVAQFAARLDMRPTADLTRLCGLLELAEVPGERQYDELEKLLLKGARPSVGLSFLERADQLDYAFPELSALRDVPQSPKYHPEGDVWIHTLMVVDEAARLRDGNDDLALMFGALCHDFGKPLATQVEEDGRVRSKGHAQAGVAPAKAFLERLKAPNQLVSQVSMLVDKHLEPELFPAQRAGPSAYRRLARSLAAEGVSMDLLERVARADQLGRTTENALARRTPGCDEFRRVTASLEVTHKPVKDVVMGRHLLERGWRPGPDMGVFLTECRNIQYEHGTVDIDEIVRLASGARKRATRGIAR